jgi:hypothetical protein
MGSYKQTSLSNFFDFFFQTSEKSSSLFKFDFLFIIFSNPYLINFFFPVFSTLFFDDQTKESRYPERNPTLSENTYTWFYSFLQRNFFKYMDIFEKPRIPRPRNIRDFFRPLNRYSSNLPKMSEATFDKIFDTYPDVTFSRYSKSSLSPLFEVSNSFDYFRSDVNSLRFQNYFSFFYGSTNVDFFFHTFVFPYAFKKKKFTYILSNIFFQIFFNFANFIFFTSPRIVFHYQSYFFKTKTQNSKLFIQPSFSLMNLFTPHFKFYFQNILFSYFKFINEVSSLQDLDYYAAEDRSFDDQQALSDSTFHARLRDLNVVDDEDVDPDVENILFSEMVSNRGIEDFTDDDLFDSFVGDDPFFEIYVFADDFTLPTLTEDELLTDFTFPFSLDYVENIQSLEQLSFESNELSIDELLFQTFYINRLEKFLLKPLLFHHYSEIDLVFDGDVANSQVEHSPGNSIVENPDEFDSFEDTTAEYDDDFLRHPSNKTSFLIAKNYSETYTDLNTKWLTINKSFHLKPLPPFLYGIGKVLPTISRFSFLHSTFLKNYIANPSIDENSYKLLLSPFFNSSNLYHKHDINFLKNFIFIFQSPIHLYPKDTYMSLFIVLRNFSSCFPISDFNNANTVNSFNISDLYSYSYNFKFNPIFFFSLLSNLSALTRLPFPNFNNIKPTNVGLTLHKIRKYDGLPSHITIKNFFRADDDKEKIHPEPPLYIVPSVQDELEDQTPDEFFKFNFFINPRNQLQKLIDPRDPELSYDGYISTNSFFQFNSRLYFYLDDLIHIQPKRHTNPFFYPLLFTRFLFPYSAKYHPQIAAEKARYDRTREITNSYYPESDRQFVFLKKIRANFDHSFEETFPYSGEYKKSKTQENSFFISKYFRLFDVNLESYFLGSQKKFFYFNDIFYSIFQGLKNGLEYGADLPFFLYSMLRASIPEFYKLTPSIYTFKNRKKRSFFILDLYISSYRLERPTKIRNLNAKRIKIVRQIVRRNAHEIKFNSKTKKNEIFIARNSSSFNSNFISRIMGLFKTASTVNATVKNFKFNYYGLTDIDLFFTNSKNPYLSFFAPFKAFSFYRFVDSFFSPYQYTFPIGNYFFDYFIYPENEFESDFNIFDIYMDVSTNSENLAYIDEESEEIDDYFPESSIDDGKLNTDFDTPDGSSDMSTFGIANNTDYDILYEDYFDESFDFDEEDSFELALDTINPLSTRAEPPPSDSSWEEESVSEPDVDIPASDYNETLEGEFVHDDFYFDNDNRGPEYPYDFVPEVVSFTVDPSLLDRIFLNYFNTFSINPTTSFPSSFFLDYRTPAVGARRRKHLNFLLKQDHLARSFPDSKIKIPSFRRYNFRKSLYAQRYKHFKVFLNNSGPTVPTFRGPTPFYNYFDTNSLLFSLDDESEETFIDDMEVPEFYEETFDDYRHFLDQSDDDIDPDFFDFALYTSVPFARFFFGHSTSPSFHFSSSDYRYKVPFSFQEAFYSPFKSTSSSLTPISSTSTGYFHKFFFSSPFYIFFKFIVIQTYKFFKFLKFFVRYSILLRKPEQLISEAELFHFRTHLFTYSPTFFISYFSFVKNWLVSINEMNLDSIRFNYAKFSFNPLYYSNDTNLNEGKSKFLAYESDTEILNLEFFFETSLYTNIISSTIRNKVSIPVFFWNYDEYFLYNLNSLDPYDFNSETDLDQVIWPNIENINVDSTDESLDTSAVYEEFINTEAHLYFSSLEIFILAVDEFFSLFIDFFVKFFTLLKFEVQILFSNTLTYWESGWLLLYVKFGYIVTLFRSFLSIIFFLVLSIYIYFILPYFLFFLFPYLTYFSYFSFFSLSFAFFLVFFAFICFKNFRNFYISLSGDEYLILVFGSIYFWLQNVYFGYYLHFNPLAGPLIYSEVERPDFAGFVYTKMEQKKYLRPQPYEFDRINLGDYARDTYYTIGKYRKLLTPNQHNDLLKIEGPRTIFSFWDKTNSNYKITNKNFFRPPFYTISSQKDSFSAFFPRRTDDFIFNTIGRYTLPRAKSLTHRGFGHNDFHLSFRLKFSENFVAHNPIDQFSKSYTRFDYVYYPHRVNKRLSKFQRYAFNFYNNYLGITQHQRKNYRLKEYPIFDNINRTAFAFKYSIKEHPYNFVYNYKRKIALSDRIRWYSLTRRNLTKLFKTYAGVDITSRRPSLRRFARTYIGYKKFFPRLKSYGTSSRYFQARPFHPSSDIASYWSTEFNTYSPYSQSLSSNAFSDFSIYSLFKNPIPIQYNFKSVLPTFFYPSSLGVKPNGRRFYKKTLKKPPVLTSVNSSKVLGEVSSFTDAAGSFEIENYNTSLTVFQKRYFSQFIYYKSFRKGFYSFTDTERYELLKRNKFNSKSLKTFSRQPSAFASHFKFSAFRNFAFFSAHNNFFKFYYYGRTSYNIYSILCNTGKDPNFTTYASRLLYANFQNFKLKTLDTPYSRRANRSKRYRRKRDDIIGGYSMLGDFGMTRFIYWFNSFVFNSTSSDNRFYYKSPRFPYSPDNKSLGINSFYRRRFEILNFAPSGTSSNFFMTLPADRAYNSSLITLHGFYPFNLISFDGSSLDSFSKRVRDLAIFRLSFLQFIENRKKFLSLFVRNETLPVYSSSNYVGPLLFSFLFYKPFFSSTLSSNLYLMNDLAYFNKFSISPRSKKFVTQSSSFNTKQIDNFRYPLIDMFGTSNRLDNFFKSQHLFTFNARSLLRLQRRKRHRFLRRSLVSQKTRTFSLRASDFVSDSYFHISLFDYLKKTSVSAHNYSLKRLSRYGVFSRHYSKQSVLAISNNQDVKSSKNLQNDIILSNSRHISGIYKSRQSYPFFSKTYHFKNFHNRKPKKFFWRRFRGHSSRILKNRNRLSFYKLEDFFSAEKTSSPINFYRFDYKKTFYKRFNSGRSVSRNPEIFYPYLPSSVSDSVFSNSIYPIFYQDKFPLYDSEIANPQFENLDVEKLKIRRRARSRYRPVFYQYSMFSDSQNKRTRPSFGRRSYIFLTQYVNAISN